MAAIVSGHSAAFSHLAMIFTAHVIDNMKAHKEVRPARRGGDEAVAH